MTADNRENIVTSLLYFSCSLYSPSSDLLSLNINSMTVLQFRGHTDQQTNMMEAASAAFTVFFTLESLLKIGACGWRVGGQLAASRRWRRLCLPGRSSNATGQTVLCDAGVQ